MTATNHALAGAVVALAVREPVLALPLALLSHFALDVLPHFGLRGWEERRKHLELVKVYLACETVILLIIFSTFWLIHVPNLVYICSIVAMSPDFAWGYRFIFLEKLGTRRPPPMHWFNKWHSAIQTRETIKPGIFIETGIAIFLVLSIWSLLS